ncbi:MAG: hypothetical protein HDT20_07995 [Oscillibacter sp.]|nr:hypothetical protein [Oscillibacter sp.]
MTTKENPRPRRQPEAGQGENAAYGRAAFSTANSSTMAANRQAGGRIFDLLLEGEENAIPASDLARLAGYRSTRSLRAEIDREREQDDNFLILASEAGYYRPAPGNRGIVEMRRFVRRTDARAASNRRTIRKIREALRAAEKAQIEGQETLFGGGVMTDWKEMP